MEVGSWYQRRPLLQKWVPVEPESDVGAREATAYISTFWASHGVTILQFPPGAMRLQKRPSSRMVVGTSTTQAVADLDRLYAEASTENWDSYGASPVSWPSLVNAKRFISYLPSQLPVPEISADPDGEVAFEWYAKPNYVLAVSVGADGTLNYAGVFGENKVHGVEHFSGRVPKAIVEHLERLCSEGS